MSERQFQIVSLIIAGLIMLSIFDVGGSMQSDDCLMPARFEAAC